MPELKLTRNLDYEGFFHREIATGVHLLGGCYRLRTEEGDAHSHLSAYLVVGKNGSALIDTGHARDHDNILAYIRSVVGDELSLIVPTHPEYPHSGNLGALLAAFPNAVAVGDMRDYHLFYPAVAGRFRDHKAGDRFDLGGREIILLPAPIHDLPNTMWAYDTGAGIMFVSDAFAYTHQAENECTLFSTELPKPPSPSQAALVIERALYWPRFSDASDLIEEMSQLFDTYPTGIVAPAHGNVVTNPLELAEVMNEALRAARLPPSG